MITGSIILRVSLTVKFSHRNFVTIAFTHRKSRIKRHPANNFAFEVKVILGLETTFLVCRVAGLFGDITNSAPTGLGWGFG